MREITNEILQFSDFLNTSWSFIELYFEKDTELNGNLSNWLQANWEILVESAVCDNGEFILVYGDGADFDDSESSRVTYKSVLATHCIKVKTRKNNIIDFYSKEVIKDLSTYHFNQFVSIDTSNKIGMEPEFDFAELEDESLNKKVWVYKNDLIYFL
jgi:hypothetical protein